MNSLRIAHLSDPHFGTILPGVREAVLHTVLELKPQAVVITGDITQRARAWQFNEAHRFIQGFQDTPTLVIPGNHDIPLYNLVARLFFPLRNYNHHFKKELPNRLILGETCILGLNSTFRFYSIQGRMDLEHLRHQLGSVDRNEIKTLILALHHPLDCAKTIDKKNLLTNREQVIKILSEYKVDLVLNGHIHDPFWSLTGQTFKRIEHSTIISLAGTCTSWRTRKNAPNSFNLIEIQNEDFHSVKITRFDKTPDHAFFEKDKISFQKKPGSGWEKNT